MAFVFSWMYKTDRRVLNHSLSVLCNLFYLLALFCSFESAKLHVEEISVAHCSDLKAHHWRSILHHPSNDLITAPQPC